MTLLLCQQLWWHFIKLILTWTGFLSVCDFVALSATLVTFHQTLSDIEWFPIYLWLCCSVSNSDVILSNSFWFPISSDFVTLSATLMSFYQTPSDIDCFPISSDFVILSATLVTSYQTHSDIDWFPFSSDFVPRSSTLVTFHQTHSDIDWFPICLWLCYSVSNSGDISSNSFWHRLNPISSDFVALWATLVTFHQTHFDIDRCPICLRLCCSVSNSGDISSNLFWHRMVSYLSVTLLLCQKLWWHFIKLILTLTGFLSVSDFVALSATLVTFHQTHSDIDWFHISSYFVTLSATLVTFHQTHFYIDWFPICLWLCYSVSNSDDISSNSFWHRLVPYLSVTLLLCQQLWWHFIKLILT